MNERFNQSSPPPWEGSNVRTGVKLQGGPKKHLEMELYYPSQMAQNKWG